MRFLRTFVLYAGSMFFVVLIAVVLLQIGSRYGARFLPWVPLLPWTEELSRFVFVGMVSFGSSMVMRDGSYVRVEFLVDLMNKRGSNSAFVYGLAMDILLLCFHVFLGYGAWHFWLIGFRSSSPTLGISFAVVHVAVLIMVVLNGLEVVLHMVDALCRKAGGGES